MPAAGRCEGVGAGTGRDELEIDKITTMYLQNFKAATEGGQLEDDQPDVYGDEPT